MFAPLMKGKASVFANLHGQNNVFSVWGGTFSLIVNKVCVVVYN